MATPINKAPAVENLLTDLFGVDRHRSIKDCVCVICGEPESGFKDALSEREYRISGICQSCQDIAFGPSII
jgi:hypothetical protein